MERHGGGGPAVGCARGAHGEKLVVLINFTGLRHGPPMKTARRRLLQEHYPERLAVAVLQPAVDSPAQAISPFIDPNTTARSGSSTLPEKEVPRCADV